MMENYTWQAFQRLVDVKTSSFATFQVSIILEDQAELKRACTLCIEKDLDFKICSGYKIVLL